MCHPHHITTHTHTHTHRGLKRTASNLICAPSDYSTPYPTSHYSTPHLHPAWGGGLCLCVFVCASPPPYSPLRPLPTREQWAKQEIEKNRKESVWGGDIDPLNAPCVGVLFCFPYRHRFDHTLSVSSLWLEQKHNPKPASKWAPTLWTHMTADLKQLNAQINNNWGIHLETNTNRSDNQPKGSLLLAQTRRGTRCSSLNPAHTSNGIFHCVADTPRPNTLLMHTHMHGADKGLKVYIIKLLDLHLPHTHTQTHTHTHTSLVVHSRVKSSQCENVNYHANEPPKRSNEEIQT